MNLSDDTVKKIKGLIIFTVIAVIIGVNWRTVASALFIFVGILMPFIVGACAAFVANIPMSFIEKRLCFIKKKGIRRAISFLLTLLLFLIVIAFVFVMVIPQLGESILILQKRIPLFFSGLLTGIESFIAEHPDISATLSNIDLNDINIDWGSLTSSVYTWLRNGIAAILPGTVTAIAGIASGVTNGVIGFIFAIYILFGKERLGRQFKTLLRALLSKPRYDTCLFVLRLMSDRFSAFVTGQCLEACILGAMFFVALTIFGMPYAALIGVLIAVTALIPIFGTIVGCIVGAFMMLMQSPVTALGFVILFLVIQQIEGNLIYPHVVGSKIELPGMWVLLAVTLGGSFFGVAGMLFFIPMFSVAYALLRDYVRAKSAYKDQKT